MSSNIAFVTSQRTSRGSTGDIPLPHCQHPIITGFLNVWDYKRHPNDGWRHEC